MSFRGLQAAEGGGTYFLTFILTNGSQIYPPSYAHSNQVFRPVNHLNGNPNYFSDDTTGVLPNPKPTWPSNHEKLITVINIPIRRKWITTIYTNGTVLYEETVFRNGDVRIKKSDSASNPFDYQRAYSDPTSP